MTDTGTIRMSQGLDVLQPKSGEAYPIPCQEWDHLKDRVSRLGTEPWFFSSVGSLLIGASLTTFIAIVVGGIGEDPNGRNILLAWAAVAICCISGAICIIFALKEKSAHRERATDIVTSMTLLERRFERHAA